MLAVGDQGHLGKPLRMKVNIYDFTFPPPQEHILLTVLFPPPTHYILKKNVVKLPIKKIWSSKDFQAFQLYEICTFILQR